MRGYLRLKREGQLGRLTATRDALTNTRIQGCGERASAAIYGASLDVAELATRQYLLRRVITPVWLYQSLLASLGDPHGAIAHPLPSDWRDLLRQQGFRVARVRSVLAWNGYVVLLFAYGLVTIVRQALRSTRELIAASAPPMGRSAFFVGIGRGNLPQPDRDGRSHDVITWYRRWPGRRRGLDALCHGVAGAAATAVDGTAVIAVAGPVPPLTSVRALIGFGWWSVIAAIRALFDLLRGRWWHAVMLHEAVPAAMARLHETGRLAGEYLLHHSDSLYRPLWTYEAARRGSTITFYFYSTNNESFRRPEGYPVQSGSWQVMNWPRYLVWDEPQADFVRRAVGPDAAIDVVGPIWFSTTAEPMPELPPDCVAVFDVQPFRPSRYQILGMPHEFYTPHTASRFLIDIHDAVRERSWTMALKRKRQIGALLHRGYAATVQRLSGSADFITIHPDTSAQRLIESAAAVISMPFTSTALLAREMGKPSIYYDPHGFIEKDDRAAHGIPVVDGIAGLRAWLAGLDPGSADSPAAPATTAAGGGAR